MQMDGAPIPAELRHPLAPGMATGIDPILAECWAEYPRLKAAGAAYSALVRLAEITNVLDLRDTAIRLSRKWKLTVGGTQIADAMCGRAIAEAMKNVSRLRRMLTIGTTQAAAKRNWGAPIQVVLAREYLVTDPDQT